MLKQLEAMGMPRQMLQNLTEEQKQAMFAMVNSPEILAKAQERVAHEEEWKQEGGADGYEWKNSRDDVFVKFKGVVPGNAQCDIAPDHLKISSDGKVLMDRQLFQTVNVEDSTWEVQGDILVVSLRKSQAPMRWLSLHR